MRPVVLYDHGAATPKESAGQRNSSPAISENVPLAGPAVINGNIIVANNEVAGHDINILTANGSSSSTQEGTRNATIHTWLDRWAGVAHQKAASFPNQYFASKCTEKLMESQKFRDCLGKTSSTLLIWGDPGVGKTTTMQGVFRELRKGSTLARNLVGIFFDMSIQDGQTIHSVMIDILRQLLQQHPGGLRHVQQLYNDNVDECPDASKTVEVIVDVLSDSQAGCIIVDAIDECGLPLSELLERLEFIQRRTSVGIIMTDRHDHRREWKQHFVGKWQLKQESDPEDMKWYLHQRLKSHEIPVLKENDALKQQVFDVVLAMSGGNFAFVRVSMDFLASRQIYLPVNLQSDLESISNLAPEDEGLGDKVLALYGHYLKLLNKGTHDNRCAKWAFRCILDAIRPLTVKELQLALAWIMFENPHTDQTHDWSDISRSCLGLIGLSGEAGTEKVVGLNNNILRLLLESKQSPVKIELAHVGLGGACVKYLSQPAFSEGICNAEVALKERLDQYPLLRYAAKHWTDHFSRSEDQAIGSSPHAGSLPNAVFKFLMKDGNVESYVQAAELPDPSISLAVGHETSGHSVSSKSPGNIHNEALVHLLASQGDTRILTPNRRTVLHVATHFGFLELTQALLKHGKSIDAIDWWDQRTPLHFAAYAGRTEIVQYLLDKDANRLEIDRIQQTPFSLACLAGTHDTIQTFLRKQVRPKEASLGLHNAVQHGYGDIVKDLLEADLPLDLLDMEGYTPVHIVAMKADLNIAKQFRDIVELTAWTRPAGYDIEGNMIFPQCRYLGCNTLHLACTNKDGGAFVKNLFETLPDKTMVDLCGALDALNRTPLHIATVQGAVDVVKILLDQTNVPINAKDDLGRSPVKEGIRYRHDDIVKLLLAHPDCELDDDDIHYTSRYGNENISKSVKEKYGGSRRPSGNSSRTGTSEVQTVASSSQAPEDSPSEVAQPQSSSVNGPAKLKRLDEERPQLLSLLPPQPGGGSSTPSNAPGSSVSGQSKRSFRKIVKGKLLAYRKIKGG